MRIVRRAAASSLHTVPLSGLSFTASAGSLGAPSLSQLATAAAALSAGQSADFTAGAQSNFTADDLAWQTACYHDDLHDLIHLMAKRQNDADAWGHQIFAVSPNTWGSLSEGMWNNDGHVYGNTAIDYTNGDLFQSRNISGPDNGRRARWWKHAQQNWNSLAPVSQNIYAGTMNDTPNGLAFHPNLYGIGQKGLVWGDQVSFHCLNFATDAVTRIAVGTDEYGAKEGAAVYWPAQDCVIMGGSTPSGSLGRIDPNGGATPTLTDLGTPVIRTQGASHEVGAGFGSLHVHPGNPNKLLIVETSSSKVYSSSDGSNWTQVADHPFTVEPRVVCSLRGGLGCLYAIGAAGTTPKLYKPAA